MSIQPSGVVKRGRKRMADQCETQRCHEERVTSRVPASSGQQRQYACPFMARDPFRSECRKGYSNISRMKEHLRRRHARSAPSVVCPRCFSEFKDPTERWEHFRNLIPCELSSEPPASYRDCISKETSDALNRRTKRRESPEESWRHIYQTIYPGTSEEDIPPPFLDAVFESHIANPCRAKDKSTAPTTELPHQMLQSLANTFKALDPSLQEAFRQIVQENGRTTEGRGLDRIGSQPQNADYDNADLSCRSYVPGSSSTLGFNPVLESSSFNTSTLSEHSFHDTGCPGYYDGFLWDLFPEVTKSNKISDHSMADIIFDTEAVDPGFCQLSEPYPDTANVAVNSVQTDAGLKLVSSSL